MKGLLALTLLIFVSSTFVASDGVSSRVVGGQDSLYHNAPFMISLQWVNSATSRQHFCGGVLLDERWILTAASCLLDLPFTGRLEVSAGLHRLSDRSNSQDRIVAARVIHEGYQGNVSGNDLAMLFVEEPFEFNDYVKAINLPGANVIHSNNAMFYGWGSTLEDENDPDAFPDVLQVIFKPIITFSTCFAQIGEVAPLVQTNLCTGPVYGGISGCVGDAGGPLIALDANFEPELVGIFSWGFEPCGGINAPSVYVRVSAFTSWINNVRT